MKCIPHCQLAFGIVTSNLSALSRLFNADWPPTTRRRAAMPKRFEANKMPIPIGKKRSESPLSASKTRELVMGFQSTQINQSKKMNSPACLGNTSGHQIHSALLQWKQRKKRTMMRMVMRYNIASTASRQNGASRGPTPHFRQGELRQEVSHARLASCTVASGYCTT